LKKIPKYLYKYRSFNVNTVRLLNLSETYYADPEKFNDPLDCNPTIHVDTEMKELERLLYEWISKNEGKDKALQTIDRHRYDSSEIGDRLKDRRAEKYYCNLLASNIKRLLHQEMGNHGVLSLSKRWNCPLLWSHYGDEHRGMCIEYDVENSEFNGLMPVNYSSSRLIRVSDLINWKMGRNDEFKTKVFESFYYSKAPQWKYEVEWRDVALRSGGFPLTSKVSSITFGLRCDPSVIANIVRLFINCSHTIKFYSVYSSENGFQLKRYKIDTSEIEALGIYGPANFDSNDIFVEAVSE